MKFVATVIFMIGIFVSPLEAGVLMISEQESYGYSKGKTYHKSYVDRDRMRVEAKGVNTDQIIIFRKDKELFWIVNNKEKTFMEITKRDLEGAGKQTDEAMKTYEEHLKNLPPGQRKMVEQMMKGRMPMKSTQGQTMYKKVASGKTVHRWICDQYEGYRDGRKRKEIWTTDWKDLGLSPEDFKAMKDMSTFFKKHFKKDSSSFYEIGSEEWEKEQGYSGVPVKTIVYSNEKIVEKTELKEVRHQNFPSSLFDLPGGLKKENVRGD